MELDSFQSTSLLGLSAVSSSDTEVESEKSSSAESEKSSSGNATGGNSTASAKKKKMVKNTSEFELDTESNRTIMRNEWLFNQYLNVEQDLINHTEAVKD
jgi:hypothetical protein